MSSLVPFQNEKLLPLPALYCALGMAASYYTYSFLIAFKYGQFLLLGLLFAFIVAINLLRVLKIVAGEKRTVLYKLAILSAAVTLGFTLGIAARRNVRTIPELGLAPENIVSVSGILKEDPRKLQSGSGLGTLELKECGGQGGLRATARGSISVFFPAESIPRLKEFGRGSEIYIDGILVYQAGKGQGPLFRASSLHITKPAPAIEQIRTGLRMALFEKFQGRENRKMTVWGPLASALLLGVRDDLDADLAEGFRNSGCSHVLALSGMHLAILSGLLAFLLKRPLGIRWASLGGSVFVVFYIFLAGAQPSLVRAGIMYLIATVTMWGFLKNRPISLLSMAFIIQLCVQNETGISISFILSYLALAGILSMGEYLRGLFRGRLPEIVNGGVSASIGAFIFTAPVVVYYFGTLRPVGILAALVLAPVSSLFMILALGVLAASYLPLPIWNIFNFLLTALYRFLQFSVSLAGRFPGFNFINPIPVLVFSILFFCLVLFIRKKDRAKRSSIASFD